MDINKEQTIEQIKNILNQLRPYINQDGGDVEFISFDDGIVKIQMLGACVGCGVVDMTVKQGIEQALVEEVPGVIGVDDVTEHGQTMW